MLYYDVDVALSEIPVNAFPLIDSGDGSTVVTSIVYNSAGMSLEFHFTTCNGTYTVTSVTPTTGGSYDWAHQGKGMYTIEIPATGGASINNDTEGEGYFVGKADGVYVWRGPTLVFRHAKLNDALIEDSSFGRAVNAIVTGTAATTGSTTTVVATSTLNMSINASDQLNGRVLVFAKDTTTASLRGASSIIQSITGTGTAVTITVSPALPTSAVDGDLFTVQ